MPGIAGQIQISDGMDTRLEKAFELSSDSTKVLFTLAAAILALTLTLATDVGENLELLGAAWVAYFISVLAGVWKLNSLTGELERAAFENDLPSLKAGAVVVPSWIQAAAFTIGTALLVVYGLFAVS